MNRRSPLRLSQTLTALATVLCTALTAPHLAAAAEPNPASAAPEASPKHAEGSKSAKGPKHGSAAKGDKKASHGSTPKSDGEKRAEAGPPTKKDGHGPAEREEKAHGAEKASSQGKGSSQGKDSSQGKEKSAAGAGSKKGAHPTSPKPIATRHLAEPALAKLEPAAPAVAPAASPKERRTKRTATSGAGKGAERASDSKAPSRRAARELASKRRCVNPSVTMDRGGQEARSFSLFDCHGKPVRAGRTEMSVLARPWSVPRPSPKLVEQGLRHPSPKTGEFAPGVRLMEEGLAHRIAAIANHFPDATISLVSGYRPQSRGSMHQSGRAVDFHLSGVPNEAVIAFCRTLPDTGCGYYPNSSFVHVDARDKGKGSATWIDASGPGEAPHYVSEWPPRELPSQPPTQENVAAAVGEAEHPLPAPLESAASPSAEPQAADGSALETRATGTTSNVN